jgi:hypothetical protein
LAWEIFGLTEINLIISVPTPLIAIAVFTLLFLLERFVPLRKTQCARMIRQPVIENERYHCVMPVSGRLQVPCIA